MGRPSHQPDPALRRQVEALAGYGIPEAEIAGVVGIDAKTLRKHYRHELDHGHTKANARVAESLYRKATGDGAQSVTAAIFWLKTRARWRETVVNEVTVDAGNSIRLLMQRIAVSGRRIQDRDPGPVPMLPGPAQPFRPDCDAETLDPAGPAAPATATEDA